jgi:hypothetical protein
MSFGLQVEPASLESWFKQSFGSPNKRAPHLNISRYALLHHETAVLASLQLLLFIRYYGNLELLNKSLKHFQEISRYVIFTHIEVIMLIRSIKTVAFGLFACLALHAPHARALDENVTFEGTVQYRLQRVGYNTVNASGRADRLANYGYNYHNARAILVASRGGFIPGRDLYGATVAQSSSMPLDARSAYTNIGMSGRGNVPRGRYRMVLLAVNNNREILAYHNFRGGFTARRTMKVTRSAKLTATTKSSSKFFPTEFK